MRLFSYRSQKTSKCGKNISDPLAWRLVGHFFVLTTFNLTSSVIYNWPRTAKWNLFVKWIYYSTDAFVMFCSRHSGFMSLIRFSDDEGCISKTRKQNTRKWHNNGIINPLLDALKYDTCGNFARSSNFSTSLRGNSQNIRAYHMLNYPMNILLVVLTNHNEITQ